MGLNHLLADLPEAPAFPSNFTALVQQAVEREAALAQGAQNRGKWWSTWRWLPRVAAACCAVMAIGTFSYQRHIESNRRVMAHSVTELSQFVVAPTGADGDMDAIQWLVVGSGKGEHRTACLDGMSPLLRRIFWLLPGLSAGLFLVTPLAARDAQVPPVLWLGAGTNAAEAPLLPQLKFP